jgi:diacylglycerol O-acyltransferase
MDRPNNLMHVHSLMWYDGSPAWGDVYDTIQERVIARFPVFSRRPVELDGQWMWEDDPDFDLKHHLRRVKLPGRGDVDDLRAYVSDQFSADFDHERPLWEMEVIKGVTGLGDKPVTVTFSRFHHALADGIRLVQMMLSLCDAPDLGALPPDVGRKGSAGALTSGLDVARHTAGDLLDIAKGVGATAIRLPIAVTQLRPSSFEHGLGAVLRPSRLLDAVADLSSVDNQSMNTVTELTRMLAAGRSVDTTWSGTPGVAKQVDWVTGLDLGQVKRFGRRHNGTVNDVLLAVISRALTRYLDEKDALVDELHWLVPVSLLPLNRNLPEDLGNHFSLIFMSMPLGVHDPETLVAEIKANMTRLKESAEPVVTFGIQWVLGESPKTLAVGLTNFFANKGVGVLTNVPGPSSTMTFAGVPVAGALGWAPTSGDQPLSISIFSYNGAVNIGIAADAHLVPDPDRIAELIQAEYDALVAD